MALHTRITAYSGQTRFDLTFVSNNWRHPWDPTLEIAFRKMSTMANTTPIVTTVTKPATNPEREKTPRDADAAPRINIQDFYEEYYKDILPIIMDKIRHDKRKEVHARLDFGKGSRERRIREDTVYEHVITTFTYVTVEPSTPNLINNVQDDVIGDDQSVPHVSIYQPTPKGSMFWILDAKNKPVEGKVFDTLKLALKFYKDYGKEAGFKVKRGGENVHYSNVDVMPNSVLEGQMKTIGEFTCSLRNIIIVTLLDSEHIKKYRWLLKRFKKIFGKAPKVVVTDQDPVMKVAIKDIFPDSRHRLCMWYIMKKLAGKVGLDLCSNTDFKKCFCDIVWTDRIDPDIFESKWNSIMLDFKLNDRLNDMFGMRYNWIPTYFLHEPMSGLMQMTSRSESDNHFLGQLTNPDLSLVEFLSHYDTSSHSQRFEYGKNTHDSNYTTLDFKIHLQVKKEAAELYTITLFYDVQDEIWSSLMHCYSLSSKEVASASKPECVLGSVLREIYSSVEQSVTHLAGDLEKLNLYKDAQKTLTAKAKTDVPNPPKMNTNAVYASTLGVTEPEKLDILKFGLQDEDVDDVEQDEGEDTDMYSSD
uniref:Protein FAR1-related sequence 5-like n=1 Tax=Tanacetum cinerariifolium TaxID=118510 RepID=A0A6L2N6W0_TANCI|nr:protein FAR1-related sequence 5-like [Tanacetum cinerariifolium]